ncbi:MAG: nitroreductase family protein [Lachnospiraceae bacterium]|nr:nitroreductase family protein [Lachnospiraceae bacterium]
MNPAYSDTNHKTDEILFHRISVRRYQDRKVEPEKIRQMLRAAMAAPSACNQQPWEFYVITDREILGALSKCSPFASCTKDAPCAIVSAFRDDCTVPEYAHIDLSIAMQNLWLETDALGLGGVWLGVCPRAERMKEVEEIVGMPEGLHAFAIFPFGYPAESRPQEDRFDEARIHFIGG